MIEKRPPPSVCSFSLFPNYSTSLPIQEMLYELYQENNVNLTNLMGQIKATANFLGLGVVSAS